MQDTVKPAGRLSGRFFSYVQGRMIAVFVGAFLIITMPVRADVHPLMPEYCNVLITYACHAKSLWHEEPSGGYWGDGIDAKNQNGAVRGTCNTLLTYAMLVRALDEGWIRKADVKTLKDAGLSRHELIKYIRYNLAYLAAHHKSAAGSPVPAWGYDWQSSLWMQSLGMGTLLTSKDLGDDLKADVARVAAAEAGWVASRKPRSESPGNTGAEENAWDTGAPAVALSLMPNSTSASLWMQTLKQYAANTYSHPTDKDKPGPVAALVSTKNVNSDWTLFNHNFFHPDYSQVSGMHLGEAWLILKLGDALNGSNLATEFEPFARHNVAEVWNQVLRPLLLPTGEFAYPAGNDWTYHCSTNQGYFAYIATAFGSYDAAEAEARALQHVKNRREASPAGRLLGDSNLEWWWEPLVCKRSVTAMLHHMIRPEVLPRHPAFESTVDGMTTGVDFSDVKVWLHRTPSYLFSLSYSKPRIGYFVPLADKGESAPYTTLPLKDGLLPTGDWEFRPGSSIGSEEAAGGTFWHDGHAIGAVLCMTNSIAVFSRNGFGAMGVENDSLTDPGRTVESSAGPKVFTSLKKNGNFFFPGSWINVDENLGLISKDGFSYKPAGAWNQKSVGVDHVKPRAEKGAWQMLTANTEQTASVADTFVVEETTTGIEALLQDGPGGKKYRATLQDSGFTFKPQ